MGVQLDKQQLMDIQRRDLLPLLEYPERLSHYADEIVQAQQRILQQQTTQTVQQLGQCITDIMQQLGQSEQVLRRKKMTRLHRWLGLDFEQRARQDDFFYRLNDQLKAAQTLGQQLKPEHISLSTTQQRLNDLQQQLEHYIVAAEQFVQECPQFCAPSTARDQILQRLAQKIHSLQTVRTANDLAIAQLNLNIQLNLTMMDRLTELVQVLIPTWQQRLHGQVVEQHLRHIDQVDTTRQQLLEYLTISPK